MAEQKRQLPPYVPWRTFETYLDALKAFGPTLPNVIDRDSMRTFSGATQTWLLHALRSLNFIDDGGVPKPRLNQIVHANADERKPMYRQVLEAEYPFIKGVNMQGVTPKQLEGAFEEAGATGDTVRKCMSFFVGMAKAADLPLSALVLKVRRRTTPRNGTTKPRAKKITEGMRISDSIQAQLVEQGTKPTFQTLYELLSPDMSKDEEAAIWTLIRYVKKKEGTRK